MADVWVVIPVLAFFGVCGASCCRSGRIDPEREHGLNGYTKSLLAFSGVGVLFLYPMPRIQGGIGLNPTDMVNVTPALAFNTAVSFVTNTNWQNYGGESTL